MRVLLLASTVLFATTSMAGMAMHGYVAITGALTAASLGWVSRTLNLYGKCVVTPWAGKHREEQRSGFIPITGPARARQRAPLNPPTNPVSRAKASLVPA